MSIDFPHGAYASIMAFLSAFVFALLGGRPLIRRLLSLKIGQMIQSFDGFLLASLHKDKKNRPTMGGLLIIAATFLSCCIWADLTNSLVRILLGSLCLFGLTGACDDWGKLRSKSSKGLPAKLRMILESLIAVCVIGYLWSSRGGLVDRLFVPWYSSAIVCGGLVLAALQWFTIVGCANAVNLTDGQDGLAAGLCSIAIVPLICYALCVVHAPQIAICLAALCGASHGFLWFNAHPAAVFMGDTGSLALGGMLGVSAVLLSGELLLALVGLVFVVETLSVIIQVLFFKTIKKRIFRCAPLHHHFEYLGYPEEKITIRFWIVGIILATLGIGSLL